MSHLACSQFRPNFWRPTICAYCYRPNTKHRRTEGSSHNRGTIRGSSDNMIHDDWEFESIQRSATISTGSPVGTRERILHSEPPAELDEGTNKRRVGIVKPYAVVELNQSWIEATQELLKQKTSLTILQNYQQDGHFDTFSLSPPPLPRPRVASCSTLSLQSVGTRPFRSSTGTRSLVPHRRVKIIPKRKAPPPPSLVKDRARTSRSSSVPPQTCTDQLSNTLSSSENEVTEIRCRAKTVSINKPSIVELRPKEKTPPRKPPRTQSTFVTGEDDTGKTVITQPVSDYEPLRRPGTSQSSLGNAPLPCPTVLQQLQEMFDETLSGIAVKYLRDFTFTEELWGLEWSDITVCTHEKGQHQLYYHMHPISLESFEQNIHSTELEISQSIGPHINLSLARGLLPQAPTDLMDLLPDASRFVVRDSLPGLTPLTMVFPMWQAALSSEEYEQCVLLTLLQVLRAVKYLYCNGIVHRDLGLDTLFAENHGTDCIIKLGGFQYVLHRPGPLSATTFVYTFNELHWLGGVDTRLPPEIMDSPENVHTLDYAHTDCFAVGCLIYELMTGSSPFDNNPHLVYIRYGDDDLPQFSKGSKISTHLQRLAHLLLRREPNRRLGVCDALLLVQSLLWLPLSWLEQSVSKSDFEKHLMILRGSLITRLAQRGNQESIPLELILKAEFLASCSPSDLVRTFAVFQH